MRFTLGGAIRRINAHIALYYTNNDYIEVKDFYNVYTGELTCGRCDKKMPPFRALFHWHW